jgi:hypothetical protein
MKKRFGIIGCIVTLLLLLSSTDIVLAGTEIVAFTKTELSTSGGDIVILKLIPMYEVEAPYLCFEANGEVTTVINNSGSASIEESYVTFAATNGPNVIAGGMVTSTYSATNVTEIQTNLSSEIGVKKGKNALYTSVSGISLAYPGPDLGQEQGQADYELGLFGSHQVKTDAIFTGIISDAKFQKLKLSFELYPIEMDPPADFVNEEISLKFQTIDGVLNGYGFDFSNEIEANDITCTSSMTHIKGGD